MDTIYVSIHHSTIEVQWKYEIPREFHLVLLQEVCGHEG